MKICVAGQGAFGQKHLDALKRIPGVEVTSLVGGNQDSTAAVAKKYGIPHYTGELSEGIKRADGKMLLEAALRRDAVKSAGRERRQCCAARFDCRCYAAFTNQRIREHNLARLKAGKIGGKAARFNRHDGEFAG